MFRLLRADEIDCRAQAVKNNGLSLLLYKDARCDMNILDETVGAMNWQRHHSRDNANCIVSIWDSDKKMWIEKEDTGTESNTEKEKGLASDSFKRACVNFGIGRELYTAPFIWIPANLCRIEQNNGKYYCKDRFSVKSIEYENGCISRLEIKNERTGTVVFETGKDEPKTFPVKMDVITQSHVKTIESCANATGVQIEKIEQHFNKKIADFTIEDFKKTMDMFKNLEKKEVKNE